MNKPPPGKKANSRNMSEAIKIAIGTALLTAFFGFASWTTPEIRRFLQLPDTNGSSGSAEPASPQTTNPVDTPTNPTDTPASPTPDTSPPPEPNQVPTEQPIDPAVKIRGLWAFQTPLGTCKIRGKGLCILYESGDNTGKTLFRDITLSEDNTFTAKFIVDDGTELPVRLTLVNDNRIVVALDTSEVSFWHKPFWAEGEMTKLR